jgi:hypothetical protein
VTVAGRTIEKQRQNILMFQQKNSGKGKIQGILKHGDDLFDLEIISINDALPDIVDDTTMYIPQDFKTDMVLDFLTHPDLSHDLGVICADRGIPMVASGKKLRIGNVFTPPT